MNVRKLFCAACLLGALSVTQVACAEFIWRDRVEAGASVELEVQFQVGQTVQIFGVGDGDTDVDYFIFDRKGNSLASDARVSDAGYCEFVAPYTGTYVIELRNLGDIYNNVRLVTN
jgi:hypothetical protein